MAVRVLFVCLGNICRSPTAEGVFRALIREAGLEDEYVVDSAGTGSWHIGQSPDARAAAACSRHGIDISAHRARQVRAEDFENFDWILACDEENLADLNRMKPAASRARTALLMPFAGNPADRVVPDPYYGGAADFESTVHRAQHACRGLLAALQKARGV